MKLSFLSDKKDATFNIKVVVPLADSDVGLDNSIVRFHNSCIDAKKSDTSRFFRREALLIKNLETGDWVVRYAMGNNGKISIRKDSAALDYDAIDSLGIRFKRPVELLVRRAKNREIWMHLWRHPDVNVKLSFKLAVFGAVLGVMGFLTGTIPFLLV